MRKFRFLSTEVKLLLFKSYCYPLYTASLWAKYNEGTMSKLRVAYNSILRKLVGAPPWHSARQLFVNLNMRTLPETIRVTSHSLLRRVLCCHNSIVQAALQSDARVCSVTWRKWIHNLYTEQYRGIFVLIS